MIELIEGLPEGVVGLEAVGEVTASDYESVAMSAIEQARGQHDKVRLLYLLGERFTGYTAGAMWDDTKLGLSHPFSWERIAVVTDHEHYRTMVKGFGWLIPGHVKVFPVAELADAKAWVSA
jgi:SpoIIAA-like